MTLSGYVSGRQIRSFDSEERMANGNDSTFVSLQVAKKNLEVVPNDECRVAIEASRQNAVRLQEMLAKLFVKK